MIIIKKYISAFFVDFQWKLLSLFVAFLLWFLSANLNNPARNDQFHLLLQLHNVEVLARDSVVLLNEDALRETMIQIMIRGQRRELEALRARDPYFIASMIVPSIDLRAIDPTKVLGADEPIALPLDISVNLYPAFEHLSIRPGYVEVILDAMASERLPVDITVIGEVLQGYELRTIQLTNNLVTVTGARNIVSSVESVGVRLDVLGLSSSTEITVPLAVFDREGNDMTDMVQLSISETTAFIPVWKIAPVELVVNPVGQVASGFAVSQLHFEPETIEVSAHPDRLEGLEYVTVELDLGGANDSFAYSINLAEWLPDGVHLRRDETPSVTVAAVIEPIEQRFFNIPRDQIRIRGFAAIYQILGDTVPIRIGISGPRSLIEAVNYNLIDLELDLRNLSIGVHDVAISVDLPGGMTLVGTSPVLQVQIHEPAPEEPDEYDYDDSEYPGDDDNEEEQPE